MRAQTLSKPGRTARTLRPSSYGVFAHQHDQSLCLRTPSSSLHHLGRGLEGPTYGISIEERLAGRPSQSNGSGRCQETDTEDWDACVGYTGPVMNVGPRPHMDISGKSSPNPSLEPSGNFTDLHFSFLLHDHSSILMHTLIHSFILSFIHSSIHSSHTSKHYICN